MEFHGDISREILGFIPLWVGAVVELRPFRYQDRIHGFDDAHVFIGVKQGMDVFVRRGFLYESRRVYRLHPGSYTVKFLNVV